jgi:hypothetical protein
MPTFVRAKDPDNGAEFTTTKGHAEAAGLEVLHKDAVDKRGNPLPTKIATDLAGNAEPKKKG